MGSTYTSFRNIALQCIAEHEVVPLGGVSHRYITRLLHELAYQADLAGSYGLFRFSDNSEILTFPMGRLATDNAPCRKEELPLLRLGAMSLRHPELDYLVDAYVVLNSRISGRNLSDGETVAQCKKMALHWYRQASRHPVWIELYHTGLSQMIFGHLLAIEQVLSDARVRGSSSTVIESRDIRIALLSSASSGDSASAVVNEATAGAQSADYETIVLWH